MQLNCVVDNLPTEALLLVCDNVIVRFLRQTRVRIECFVHLSCDDVLQLTLPCFFYAAGSADDFGGQ